LLIYNILFYFGTLIFLINCGNKCLK
jgi:hypothetical protein